MPMYRYILNQKVNPNESICKYALSSQKHTKNMIAVYKLEIPYAFGHAYERDMGDYSVIDSTRRLADFNLTVKIKRFNKGWFSCDKLLSLPPLDWNNWLMRTQGLYPTELGYVTRDELNKVKNMLGY